MVNPGFQYELLNRRLKNLIQGPSGYELCIIGTALDGPLNTPVQITSPIQAESIFGPIKYRDGYLDPGTGTASAEDSGASLLKAIHSAVQSGARNIYAVRCTGTYASSPSAFGGTLDIRAKSPGYIYNSVTLTTTTTGSAFKVFLDQPSPKSSAQVIYTFSASDSVAKVIDTINRDRYNQSVIIDKNAFPAILSSAAFTAVGSGICKLGLASGVGSSVGATLGANMTRGANEAYSFANGVVGYAQALTAPNTGTFAQLENNRRGFDQFVLADLYLDDQVATGDASAVTTIAADFTAFLQRMSFSVKPCEGTIGLRPVVFRDDSEMLDYLDNNLLATTHGIWDAAAKTLKAGPFLNEGFLYNNFNGTEFDAGACLSVCAGPVILSHPSVAEYNECFHINYAAQKTMTPPERALAQAPIRGIAGFGKLFPHEYVEKLNKGVGWVANSTSGNGAYVCLARDVFTPGLVVYHNDNTAAQRENMFALEHWVRATNAIHFDIAKDLRRFLGGPVDDIAIEAMKTTINNILDGYAASGVLKGGKGIGYDYTLEAFGAGNITGEINLDLELEMVAALRKINQSITVRNS